jgi:hypothetical protein
VPTLHAIRYSVPSSSLSAFYRREWAIESSWITDPLKFPGTDQNAVQKDNMSVVSVLFPMQNQQGEASKELTRHFSIPQRFRKWEVRLQQCIDMEGDYVD